MCHFPWPQPQQGRVHTGEYLVPPWNLQANFSEIIFHPKDTGDDPVHPGSNPAPTIEWSPSKGEPIRSMVWQPANTTRWDVKAS